MKIKTDGHHRINGLLPKVDEEHHPVLVLGLFKPWGVAVFLLSVSLVIWAWFHFYVHPRDVWMQKEFGHTNEVRR